MYVSYQELDRIYSSLFFAVAQFWHQFNFIYGVWSSNPSVILILYVTHWVGEQARF